MPLNRRESASFQSAVGRGCASLVFTAVAGVGFSVTKVIVGSEYIHRCPSEDMIPVYILLSGCLPVFLSPLRQSFRKRRHSEKQDTFAMRFAFVTAVFGVVVNLAWLVAGTYLVTTTFQYGNICPKNEIMMVNNMTNKDGVVLHHNSTSTADKLFVSNNSSIYSDTNATWRETKMNSSLISYVFNNSTKSDTEDTMLTDNGENNNGSSRKESVMSDGREFRNNSSCIVCDLTILRFSLAVVIIDWIFVAFGLIYFCCFIKHFISFLKNEFPLNV